MGSAVIYRQEIIQDITLFTSEPKARFYSELFSHLDLSDFPDNVAKTGRKGFSNHAKLRAAVVMKCECFSCITDLLDYLQNNLLIAHYCGFNIVKPLPSYWTLDRFINSLDNDLLQSLMHSQVKKLYELGVIDTSFIALDSTPVMANTSQNNPKSFKKDKFKPENQPKSDKDCGLGVHTASNQHNEKNFEFYWGYKNHVLVDCITGLPIFELTTTADVSDSTVALNILSQTNSFLPINECTFKNIRFHDLRHTFATTALANGMDVKTLSAIIGHISSETTLNIYTHITDNMQRSAANKIEHGFGRNEGSLSEVEKTPDQAVKTPQKAKFEPKQPKIRRPGTGCISEINDHLFEGRYSPTGADGKRMARNVYARAREECEEKLAELITQMNAEIAAEKERLKAGQSA